MRIWKTSLSIVLSLFLLVCISTYGFACSTFMLKNNNSFIVGHNVDYYSDYMPGYIFINKRRITKTNFTINDINGKTNTTPKLRWISKYGSVTFNVSVIELTATSGINEAGLFIAEMSLPKTKYPTDDSLPHMLANQWMQYQLDNYQSIEEVLNNISKIIPENDAPNHYFISDKHGDYACIEYIDGKPLVYRGESMPIPLLCNSEYPHEIQLLKQYEGFGGTRTINTLIEETDTRFADGAYMLENYLSNPSKPVADYGFEILTKMWRGINKWAFIIDVRNSMIYFHTSRSRQMKYFSYKDFDFSADTPVKMFDLNSNTSGDIVKQFSVYSPQLIKYSIIERLKQDNPQVYNDKTKDDIDAAIKRVVNFLDSINVYEKDGKEALIKNSFVLKKIDPLKVVSIRDNLSSSGEQVKLWNELIEFLIKKGIPANGTGFTIYHVNNGSSVDIEVVIPVTKLGSNLERIKFKTLDAVDEMASVIHKGPYRDFPEAYAAIHRWIADNGYQITGPNREIWLRSDGDEKDPNEWLTEIQIPVKKK